MFLYYWVVSLRGCFKWALIGIFVEGLDSVVLKMLFSIHHWFSQHVHIIQSWVIRIPSVGVLHHIIFAPVCYKCIHKMLNIATVWYTYIMCFLLETIYYVLWKVDYYTMVFLCSYLYLPISWQSQHYYYFILILKFYTLPSRNNFLLTMTRELPPPHCVHIYIWVAHNLRRRNEMTNTIWGECGGSEYKIHTR